MILIFLVPRFSVGHSNVPFTIQSCSKPCFYGICLNELGATTVHQYVGTEPSGRAFNELLLDGNGEFLPLGNSKDHKANVARCIL